jgi:hypothetical protein
MRHIHRFRGWRRLVIAALLPLAVGGTGCATLRTTLRGYDVGPNGIARPQHRLREALAAGDFVRALAWREEDALLERLTRATTAYYAGQFLRAGALLDTAALVSDDRITARLSHDALAIVTNDNARPYRPRRTERLFIPYYGMLAYARAGSWSDAAVEARRLVGLLAQHDGDRDEGERPLHATLEHLSGAVLERAGYADEAQVAYRAANRRLDRAPERVTRPGADEGEILIVLERGFVAHRVTEKIDLYVGGDDAHRHDRDPRGDGADTATGATAPMGDPRRTTNASSVLASVGAPAPDSTRRPRRRRRHHDDGGDYWVAVAFPVLRRSTRPWETNAQLLVDRQVTDPTVRITGVVDDAASADERRDRLAMLARAAARAGAKYALAKAAKDGKGELAGTLANYGASLLERADVRSWHLLPQEIQLLRAKVPAGTHAARLQVIDGGIARMIEIGSVAVRPGALTIETVRLWRDGPSTVAIARR